MQAEVITKSAQAERQLSLMKAGFVRGRSTAFIKLDNQKWVKINFKDVIYIEAREKISIIFFSNGEYMVCKSPLYKVQCMLPLGFERIHRAFIVNVEWVDYVDVAKKQVNLKNEVSLGLGLAYKDCISKYFVNPNKYNLEDID